MTVVRDSVTGELQGDDLQQHFDRLQTKLVSLWQQIGRTSLEAPDEEDNTVVVVPSLTVDIDIVPSALQEYEERMLFMLFLLRQPRVRMIYVTAQPIDPHIVDYYLQLIPGVVSSSARKRLFLVSPHDAGMLPLSRKLLQRPRVIERIRSLIPDLNRAHLVPFTTTDLERELAVRLGIPMYAADPRFFAFGTKSGSRQVFAEEGVPHPLGYEQLYSVDEVVDSIEKIRSQRPAIKQVIVKHNEGVTGIGNAVVDLRGLPAPGDTAERAGIEERLRSMRFELPSATYEGYVASLVEQGAIVEEMITGVEVRSPSAQMRVTPLGEVELLSTHDQMLGGPSGQSYLGAKFPADPAYGPMIMREAAKVGKRFAREGIIGRFALDFVVVQQENGEWEPYAIEVNLRKGGTTHPYLTLQYLTDGTFDADSGLFTTCRGQNRWYVASDHVESHLYRAFTPDALFDLMSAHRLHFDHAHETGVILHMISGVADLGRFGLTAIAESAAKADELYQRTLRIFDEEAQAALQPER